MHLFKSFYHRSRPVKLFTKKAKIENKMANSCSAKIH